MSEGSDQSKLFLEVCDELEQLLQRAALPNANPLAIPEYSLEGLRELGNFVVRGDVGLLLYFGAVSMQNYVTTRKLGRPKVLEMQSIDAKRAFFAWEFVRHLRAWALLQNSGR